MIIDDEGVNKVFTQFTSSIQNVQTSV